MTELQTRITALRELANLRNWKACQALIACLTDDQIIEGQDYLDEIRIHSALVARDLLSEERIRRCEQALSDALDASGDMRYTDPLIQC